MIHKTGRQDLSHNGGGCRSNTDFKNATDNTVND